MGYSAKQRKVKVEVEGAAKLAKELKSMEDGASKAVRDLLCTARPRTGGAVL